MVFLIVAGVLSTIGGAFMARHFYARIENGGLAEGFAVAYGGSGADIAGWNAGMWAGVAIAVVGVAMVVIGMLMQNARNKAEAVAQ